MENIRFSILVLLVFLLIIESLCRITEKDQTGDLRMVLWPYVMYHSDISEALDFHQTNNRGYRAKEDFQYYFGEEFKKEPAENARTIIYLGGSAAFGACAKNEEMISSRMEAHLNEMNDGYKYSVINLAQVAANSFQEYLNLILYAENYSNIYAIVDITGINDVKYFYYKKMWDYGREVGFPLYWDEMAYIFHRHQNPEFLKDTNYYLKRTFASYRWLRQKIEGKAKYPMPLDQNLQDYDKIKNDSRGLLARGRGFAKVNYTRIADFAKKLDSRMIFVLQPHNPLVYEKIAKEKIAHEELLTLAGDLEEISQSKDAQFANFVDLFEGREEKAFCSYVHMTPFGQDFLAKRLVSLILSGN